MQIGSFSIKLNGWLSREARSFLPGLPGTCRVEADGRGKPVSSARRHEGFPSGLSGYLPGASVGKGGRPWKRAALWLVILAVFFHGTYGFSNWLASQRSDVGSVVFDWERHVPFIAWMIFPYWSIIVFYGLSLFVCASDKELDVHVRRLLTVQVVAVACFLLFPMRVASVKPETTGLAGFLFDALDAFDKPFNQTPSLHIALSVVLLEFYVRHATSAWRWLLAAWFASIGLSVLTIYQHHFIDIPSGALLGCVALWLWPPGQPSPVRDLTLARNVRR
ncbi:MAG TPA: phosphatase PAP2 family protein [Vineibacter sp.]|nr:phosphatase PAP2 family protein [Vineibacter sp.]